MSKNKINQNRKTNNYDRTNTSRTQKSKQPKVNPNEIKALLYLPEDITDTIREQILGVLESCKFNKISIPLGTYRCLIDSSVSENDSRVTTIGYIRKYDAEAQEFSVVIFNKFIDLIKANEHNAIELTYNTYGENLGTILKFNIIPVEYEDEECTKDSNCDCETDVVTTKDTSSCQETE